MHIQTGKMHQAARLLEHKRMAQAVTVACYGLNTSLPGGDWFGACAVYWLADQTWMAQMPGPAPLQSPACHPCLTVRRMAAL